MAREPLSVVFQYWFSKLLRDLEAEVQILLRPFIYHHKPIVLIGYVAAQLFFLKLLKAAHLLPCSPHRWRSLDICLPPMPIQGIELTSVQLYPPRGTLVQDALPTKLPQPRLWQHSFKNNLTEKKFSISCARNLINKLK